MDGMPSLKNMTIGPIRLPRGRAFQPWTAPARALTGKVGRIADGGVGNGQK